MQTAGLMVAIAIAAVLCMLFGVADLALRSYVRSDGVAGMSSLVTWIVQNFVALSGPWKPSTLASR